MRNEEAISFYQDKTAIEKYLDNLRTQIAELNDKVYLLSSDLDTVTHATGVYNGVLICRRYSSDTSLNVFAAGDEFTRYTVIHKSLKTKRWNLLAYEHSRQIKASFTRSYDTENDAVKAAKDWITENAAPQLEGKALQQ